MKKFLSMLTAVMMLFTMMPVQAFAEQVSSPWTNGGASTLAISGPNTVTVGSTIELTGSKANYSHSWSSSNTDVATVSGTSRYGTVKGLSAGTVTITHSYKNSWSGNTYTETFEVTVANLPTGTYTVFMYIHVDGDTTGLSATNGWITIGKIAVNGIPSAQQVVNANGGFNANRRYQDGQPYEQTVINAIKTGTYTAYTPNAGIITSNLVKNTIDWTGGAEKSGLCPSSGAADYNDDPDVTGIAWHIDGYLHIDFKYFVQHWIQNDNGEYVKYGDPSFVTFNATSNQVVTDNDAQISIPGYVFEDRDSQITLNKSNQTLNVYYKKANYNVSYQYEGDVPAGAPAVPATTEKTFGTTVTVEPVPVLPGYTFDGWYKDGAKVTEFTMPERDVVLTGRWSENENVTILYEATAGGSVTRTSESLAPVTGIAQGSRAEAEPGYHFVNWTNENGEQVGTDPAFVPEKVNGLNVAATYTANFEPNGTLTLKLVDDTVIYDGQEHTLSLVEVTLNGVALEGKLTFAEVEAQYGVALTLNGDPQKNVGTYPMTITGASQISYDGIPYDVTYLPGMLEIMPKAVTVTADNKTKVYGDADPALTAVVEGTLNNDTIEYTLTRDLGENVGEYTITPTGEAVQGNYTVTYVPGTLTVTARAITIKAADAEKAYDGTALTNKDSKITSGSLVNGHEYTVDVAGSIVDPGEEPNVPSAAKITDAEGNDVTANYAVSYDNGTLKITKNTNMIVITAASKEKVYDGTALTDDGYTFTQNVLADGDVLTAVVEGSRTDVGESANKVAEYHVMRGETDVTENYTFGESVDGELEVTKRNVTLTSGTDSKPYDGTALTKDEVTVSGDGFAAGEGAAYTVTGSQTLVGSSENTFTYTLNEGVNADNYDIKTQFGTLTVTGDPIIPEKTTPETVESNYKLGEKIPFSIRVENITDAELTNIAVTDPTATILAGDGYTLDNGVATIASLASGATVIVHAEHEVTEDDILRGTYGNTANVTVDDVVFTPSAETDKIDDPNGHLTVAKTTTSAPANGTAYVLGEEIHYEITVTNDGNLTITNVVVTDELTGDEWAIASLAPGATETYNATYTVTEADILAGSVVNVATAAGTSPDPENPDVPVDPGETEDPTDDPNGHLTVAKTTTSTPANGTAYVLGEEIHYEITVTNDGNLTITDVTVTDELTKDTWTIETLTVGETRTFTTSHEVTEADILAGSVVNVATATGTSPDPENPDVPVDPGETEDPTDDPNGHLTVAKTTTSTPANGTAYVLGEEIHYEITVTNDGNLTITNVTVTDELTKDTWTIETLTVGETRTFTTSHEVTEADILAGSVVNVATATGTSPDPENPDVPVDPGETEDPTDDPNGHLTVAKTTTSTPANGTAYVLGEEIHYEITVTNDGNLTITNVVVMDELTRDAWTIETLMVGETRTFTTSYTVTEADILAHSVVNVATATGTSPDPENPDVPVDPGETKDPTDDPNGHLTVAKRTTSTPANGTAYVLGEEIHYEITVTNDGNLTITNVTVTDELTGDEWTIASIAPGATETYTATYEVTEADILAGSVLNVATAAGTSPDPENPDVPVDPGETDDPTDDPNGHLTVAKTTTSTPANGTAYVLGEEISYEITVTNDGNLTITDAVVTDELTGDEWTIASLAPGATETYTATYKVTEADILAGSVLNVATAAGTSPDPENPDVPVDPGETEDPTDDPNGHLTVAKTTTSAPANGTAYVLGEEISYEITVTNDGNLTITDAVVTDELTGDEWTIASIAPGATETYTATYEVTEADILAGSVLNVATATGTSPDPENPDVPVDPGETEDPTDDPNPSFTIEKILTNLPEKGYFTVDETAEFDIVVTNDGNLTLTGIIVTEQLEGATFLPGEGYTVADNTATVTIDLKPGDTLTIRAAYLITVDDLGVELTNVVTAEGTGPQDPEDEEGEENIPTDDPVVIDGVKTWNDLDNVYGRRPESINVNLTGLNGEVLETVVVSEATGWAYHFEGYPMHTADGTLIPYAVLEDDVLGYDAAYAETGYDITNDLEQHTLTIHYWYGNVGGEEAAQTVVNTYFYGQSYNVVSPTITGYTVGTPNVSGVLEEDTVVDVIYTINPYNLTIRYWFEDGTTAAPTYTATLYYGTEYLVHSPVLPGYKVSYAMVGGVMPGRDVVLTVFYVPDDTEIVIDEYGAPLGIGNVEMNVGDCFE